VNPAGRPPAPAKSYYRDARSYSTRRAPDPPRYVRHLSKSGVDAFKDLTWLDVGLDYRFRYEYRQDDIRRNRLGLDRPCCTAPAPISASRKSRTRSASPSS
jgi:hypothetical protein